jgi:AcrR family transcriptional regulator
MSDNPFHDKPILHATYIVLRDHGYADLTISNIADELGKSKAAIYYHYDDKDDVITSFLAVLRHELSSFINTLDDNAEAQLHALLTELLNPSDDLRNLRRALLQLKAEAPFDDAIANEFRALDTVLTERIETLLDDAGATHPSTKATMLVSTIDGTLDREISYGEPTDHEALIAVLHDELLNE